MGAFLYPAIALMNRLSLALKFSLISLLFFVPILATSSYLMLDSYRQLTTTAAEQRSLDLLGKMFAIRNQIERLDNLLTVKQKAPLAGQNSDLDTQILGLRTTLTSSVSSLSGFAELASQSEESVELQGMLLTGLQTAQTPGTDEEQRTLVRKQLDNSQRLISSLIAAAGLSVDPDRTIRERIELAAIRSEEITAALSQMRAAGASSLAVGMLGSADNEVLQGQLTDLDKTREEYEQQLARVIESQTDDRDVLAAAAEPSKSSLKTVGELVEEKLLLAESYDYPWQTFFKQISAEIDKTYQLNDVILSQLDSALQKRLSRDRLQLSLLIGVLVGVLLLIAYLYSGFYASIRNTLRSLGLVMDEVAAGDMTVSVQRQSRDELGDLSQVFNGTVAKIHHLVRRVGQTIVEVEHQASLVETISGKSNLAASSQRSQIELVATAMNQMSATVQEVARSAAVAANSAQDVNRETENGRALVESQVLNIRHLAGEIDRSVTVINQLAEDSSAISQVLEVIRGIAEQTNLLALNAAIEAARAGEQGRGFAVVADEVRNLAKRTQQSTKEIEQMIGRLQSGVGAAVKAMGTSNEMVEHTVRQSGQMQMALDHIVGAVNSIVDQNQQISTAAEQQTAVANDIDRSIVQINEAGERTAEGASQTEQASQELTGQVVRLKELISAFRV